VIKSYKIKLERVELWSTFLQQFIAYLYKTEPMQFGYST